MERALAETLDAPGVARGRVLNAAAYLAFYAEELDDAGAWATEALAIGRATGDGGVTARALNTIASLGQFSDPVGTQPMLLEAAALAEVAGDVWTHVDALQKAAYSDFYRERWDEAIALLDRSTPLAEALDNPFFLAWDATLRGTEALRRGRLDDARSRLGLARRLGAAVGEPLTTAAPGSLLVLAHVHTGDLDGARAGADELDALLGPQAAEGFGGLMSAVARAAVDLASGDPGTAQARLGPVVTALDTQGILYPTADYRYYLGVAQCAAGDIDGAAATATALARDAEHLASEVARANGLLVDAVVHRARLRPDLAAERAHQALELAAAARLPLHALDALTVLGGCLVDLGRGADATRVLGGAAAVARSEGWTPLVATSLADQVRADHDAVDVVASSDADAHVDLAGLVEVALRSRGRRDRPPTGWASLTPTEELVARKVAEGLTNPEIAAALLMSRSTVKTHVSHILTKLGASTRSEIATLATQNPAP